MSEDYSVNIESGAPSPEDAAGKKPAGSDEASGTADNAANAGSASAANTADAESTSKNSANPDKNSAGGDGASGNAGSGSAAKGSAEGGEDAEGSKGAKRSESAEASDKNTSDGDAKKEQKPDEKASDAPKDESAAKQSGGDDRYVRLMAEFQNYKKRVSREKNDIREYATEKLITELLPVLDNFERALASDASADPEAYAKGMEMIFTQMKTELEKSGLKEVEALGETFDPLKHNAVMTEESEEYESGKVSKVLQKGYALNDKVIRPVMVAVTK